MGLVCVALGAVSFMKAVMISNEDLPELIGRLIRTTRRYGRTQKVQEGVLILCFAAVALGRGHEMPDDVLQEIFEHALERTIMTKGRKIKI